MNLHILGCDGTYPGPEGATSGYLVSHGGRHLLLDCGSGVMSRLMARVKPEDLSAICLTHWHNDHVADMLAMKYYCQIQKKRLRVMIPREGHKLRDFLAGDEFEYLEYDQKTEIDGFLIEALRVWHPVPAYALKITAGGKTLIYTGDLVGGEGLTLFCRGADLLLCDGAFTKAEWNHHLPHFSASQAGQLATAAQVKKLVVTHAQPGRDKALLLKEAKEQFENTTQAENGLSLSL